MIIMTTPAILPVSRECLRPYGLELCFLFNVTFINLVITIYFFALL